MPPKGFKRRPQLTIDTSRPSSPVEENHPNVFQVSEHQGPSVQQGSGLIQDENQDLLQEVLLEQQEPLGYNVDQQEQIQQLHQALLATLPASSISSSSATRSSSGFPHSTSSANLVSVADPLRPLDNPSTSTITNDERPLLFPSITSSSYIPPPPQTTISSSPSSSTLVSQQDSTQQAWATVPQSSLHVGGAAPPRRLSPRELIEGVSTPRPPVDGHEGSNTNPFAASDLPTIPPQPSSNLLVPQVGGSSSTSSTRSNRPGKISIEINTPLGTRRPVSELDDHIDQTPALLPGRTMRRGSSSSILDRGGDRATGVGMTRSSSHRGKQNASQTKDQTSANSTNSNTRGAGSVHEPPNQADNIGNKSEHTGKNAVMISIPGDSNKGDTDEQEGRGKSDITEKHHQDESSLSESAQSPTQGSPETTRALFSMKSLRNGIMNRLFHRRNDDDGDDEPPMSPNGPNEADNYVLDPAQVLHDMESPAEASSITMTEIPNYDEEAREAARKITSQRREPNHSGGILSNLLRLQALSQSFSSKSRHPSRRRRHPNSRRESFGRTAAGPEVSVAGASRHLLSTPSASVLSLPGLAFATPSGTGHNHAFTTMHPSLASGHLLASASPAAESGTGMGSATNSPRTSMDMAPPPVRMPFNYALSAPTTPTRTHAPRLDPRHYLQTSSARSSISMDDDASVYSSVSQDPLLAAFRLSQHAQLTEAVAEILLKQDLLIRLCKSLIRYGAPSHRIELAMEAMCKMLGVDGSFAFLPGLMMISFGDADTHTSETHLIKCKQGFDLGRLDKVSKITRALVYSKTTPPEALEQLKLINAEKPLYNGWMILASFTISSGLVAPLIFKGSWYDMLAAGGLGTIVGLTSILASRFSVYSNVFEVSTSIIIAFIAKALRDYVCFTGVVLSAIVMLLPGLSLTTAIMELSSRYMISGSVRMFYALVYCLFLGFGLSIGSQLWDVFKEAPLGEDQKAGYCHPATEPWRWVFFPMLAIAFNIHLHATPRQWPVMIICSAVGFAVSEILGKYWPSSQYISAAISAFVSGLLGNIYELLTHELAFVPILGAILLIVPGGMGVRSSLVLLDATGNASQGTSFALQVILVALGIAVGLFASTLVVYPLGKKRNVLLTF